MGDGLTDGIDTQEVQQIPTGIQDTSLQQVADGADAAQFQQALNRLGDGDVNTGSDLSNFFKLANMTINEVTGILEQTASMSDTLDDGPLSVSDMLSGMIEALNSGGSGGDPRGGDGGDP